MKSFLTAILAIGCATVLLFGNIHWNKKIEAHGASKSNTTLQSQDVNTVNTVEEGSTSKNQESKEAPSNDDSQLDNILILAKKWTEKSKKGLQKAISENRTYQVLFAGSNSLGSGTNSFPELVKKELFNSYGEDIISVSVNSYDSTSRDFVNEKKYEDLLLTKPDMVILEPFTLQDNGLVSIENSLKNVQTVLDYIETNSPNTTVILQPPHPLFNAKFYPIQVSELKTFAETNNIPYLDHWTAWPDQTNVEMKEFLIEDQSQPSEKGHRVWASFILDYLIAVE